MKKFLSVILLFFTLIISSCISTPEENNPSTPPVIDPGDSQDPDTPKEPDIPDTPTEDPKEETFESYGLNIIEIHLVEISIVYDGLYTSMEEVGVYLYTYKALPSNFKKKADFKRNDYTPENKLSTGGDVFYNREGLLPSETGRIYYECDIDYTGGSRNAKRIVFSSDNLIFYTSDHYESFSILKFIEGV